MLTFAFIRETILLFSLENGNLSQLHDWLQMWSALKSRGLYFKHRIGRVGKTFPCLIQEHSPTPRWSPDGPAECRGRWGCSSCSVRTRTASPASRPASGSSSPSSPSAGRSPSPPPETWLCTLVSKHGIKRWKVPRCLLLIPALLWRVLFRESFRCIPPS